MDTVIHEIDNPERELTPEERRKLMEEHEMCFTEELRLGLLQALGKIIVNLPKPRGDGNKLEKDDVVGVVILKHTASGEIETGGIGLFPKLSTVAMLREAADVMEAKFQQQTSLPDAQKLSQKLS
jgi:hypothetical protein